MSSIYIESSAVLSWLFGEPESGMVISLLNSTENIATSVLTVLETERAMIRAETSNIIKPGDRKKLQGIFRNALKSWTLMELTPEIREKASGRFPEEPVRTPDALHLSSILEFLQVFPDMKVLSFDKRILSNLVPMGVEIAGS